LNQSTVITEWTQWGTRTEKTRQCKAQKKKDSKKSDKTKGPIKSRGENKTRAKKGHWAKVHETPSNPKKHKKKTKSDPKREGKTADSKSAKRETKRERGSRAQAYSRHLETKQSAVRG